MTGHGRQGSGGLGRRLSHPRPCVFRGGCVFSLHGLDLELRKLGRNVPVFAEHPKPLHHDPIVRQLQALCRSNVSVREIGREYRFPAASSPAPVEER